MKKAIVLASAMFLFAGMVFAQTPQTPAKSTTTTTTTTKTTTATSKDKKDDKTCDPKMAKDCPTSKSCCSHGTTTAPAKSEAEPKKK